MRILWVSDHPAATSGYSVQTALTAPRLARAGLADVAILASYGQQGHQGEFEGVPVYPGGHDPFAQDVIPDTARQFNADLVITLKDSFVYKPETFKGLRWCPLVPIDHDPVPPGVVSVMFHAYAPIAYAPNGLRALRRAGFDPLYAPHAYDPTQFYPMPKAEARQLLGLPQDKFIVGTVAVNRGGIPSRKAWDELLTGVSLFRRESQADMLYITHTHPADDGYEGGLPLRQIAADCGIGDITLFPHVPAYKAGFSTEKLRWLYNSMDVLLAVSAGEGFGIPTIEAQACGVPVIAGRWAAQADLVFSGWFVEPDEAHRFRSTQMAYIYLPEPDAIADRLRLAYMSRENEALKSTAAQGAVMFQIDQVIDHYWKPLLGHLDERLQRDRMVPRGVARIVRPEEVFS